MGLVIARLFDFVLPSLSEDEVGSGSGVLNALQQLGCAVGVAIIGTIFFTTPTGHATASGRSGYVAGLERCVQVGIGIAVVVGVLTYFLPRHPGDQRDTGTETDIDAPHERATT